MSEQCGLIAKWEADPLLCVTAERDALRASHARLVKALEAACGYMENARIDLETGAPKRTAIATLKGGLALVNIALAQARALDQPTAPATPGDAA